VPRRVERPAFRRSLLADLVLKSPYLGGEMTLIELSDLLCLSSAVVEEIFRIFRKELLCEVKGMSGGTHGIGTGVEGRQRDADLLSLNQSPARPRFRSPTMSAESNSRACRRAGPRSSPFSIPACIAGAWNGKLSIPTATARFAIACAQSLAGNLQAKWLCRVLIAESL